MEKPILAIGLKGTILTDKPWENAHRQWFADASKELEEPEIAKWGELYPSSTEYFQKVHIVMQKLCPDLTKEERVVRARQIYFEYVIKYINSHSEVFRDDIIKRLEELRTKYRLALITTNTLESIEHILGDYANKFDIISASNNNEEDDSLVVYKRFVKDFGRPAQYFSRITSVDELDVLQGFTNIVVGIIVKDGKVLLGKRENDAFVPELTWSFPSGEVFFSDVIEKALQREVFIKTGLRVKVLDFLFQRIPLERNSVILSYYACEITSGEEVPGGSFKELIWVNPHHVTEYVTTSLDKRLVNYFQNL